MILAAVEKDIIRKNPCTGVSIKKGYGQLKKDILSQEEITTLVATHYDKENPDIRRAFIFCLYCGLRWCDVKDLTYANVDSSNKLLKFEQSKTKAHSAASGVVTTDSWHSLVSRKTATVIRLSSHFPATPCV